MPLAPTVSEKSCKNRETAASLQKLDFVFIRCIRLFRCQRICVGATALRLLTIVFALATAILDLIEDARDSCAC